MFRLLAVLIYLIKLKDPTKGCTEFFTKCPIFKLGVKILISGKIQTSWGQNVII